MKNDLEHENKTNDVKIEVKKNTKGIIHDCYKCKKCNLTYETEIEVREHMIIKHKIENPLACKCDKHFRDLPSVIMHRITKHPDETINSEKNYHSLKKRLNTKFSNDLLNHLQETVEIEELEKHENIAIRCYKCKMCNVKCENETH